MIRKLKIDFHVHTGEDPKDRYIAYSAREFLDQAAAYHFDAICITNHEAVFYNCHIRRYAEERGILLIPGIEAKVEGKHVLLVNCRRTCHAPLTFKRLRAYAGEDALIVAPHPFYPKSYCLHEQLEKHISVFDAIEYAHLHFRLLNFNKKAVQIARTYHLPLIGTSDTHELCQLNTTYSLVEAECTIPAIIEAVKHHHVEVVTRPLSHWQLIKRGSKFLRSFVTNRR